MEDDEDDEHHICCHDHHDHHCRHDDHIGNRCVLPHRLLSNVAPNNVRTLIVFINIVAIIDVMMILIAMMTINGTRFEMLKDFFEHLKLKISFVGEILVERGILK